MEKNINRASIKIPGKVFLLGEYTVLAGAPALLCATSQEIEFRKSESHSVEFHKDSPAGKILPLIEHYEKIGDLSGLGSSTADFIFACKMASKKMSAETLFQEYKKVSQGSGADLLAQFLGGWVRVQNGQASSLPAPKFSRQILLFSAAHQAARKVKTHEHLHTLNREQLESLRERLDDVIIRGFESLHLKDTKILGEIFNEFAEVLSERGLEHPETRIDRQVFQKVAGVMGVKGCGALMADHLVVAIDSRAETLSDVLRAGESRNLQYLGNLSHVSPGYQEVA